jgi:hypothetical protein
MNNKRSNQNKYQNSLEALKDIPSETAKSLKEDLVQKMPEDVIQQIFGGPVKRNYSGEIALGESLEVEEVISGKQEENKKIETQLTFERTLLREEKELRARRSNELSLELKALMQEVINLSQNTQELSEEVQIAAMQAPVDPGEYHRVFFEKLIEFIKSFRKKVKEAKTWLHAANARAEKKNYWAKYKKHGAKFLLAADHYLTRSAG